MLVVVLGLTASVAWGISDFLGGALSRRYSVLAIMAPSQVIGLLAITAAMVASGAALTTADIPWAIAASVGGTLGLAALYRSMAVGAISVVAPIAATSSALPVAVDLIGGHPPSGLQAVGVVLALGGSIALAAESERGAGPRIAAGSGLAVLAALGFGCFFLFMDRATDGGVLSATLFNRVTTCVLLAVVLLARRPAIAPAWRDASPQLVAIGLLDAGAVLLFATASSKGLVSLASVAASLYPLTTVILARVVLGEQLRPRQRLAALVTILGVALIGAG